MHFGEGEAELFPLGENMLVPREPSVQVESKVLTSSDWGSCTLLMYRWAGSTSRCEGDMGRLGFVGFQSPSFKPGLDCEEVRL
jgi:hypothetical protein